MGYDMYWLGHRGGAERDKGYFRLNISGGTIYAGTMVALGAACDGYEEPAWPQAPEGYHAWTEDRSMSISAEILATHHAHEVDLHAHLRWSPPGAMGVPIHKTAGTNDGWIVTADECRAAVEAIARLDPAFVEMVLNDHHVGDRAYWVSWLQWIADAISHGGFEVH